MYLEKMRKSVCVEQDGLKKQKRDKVIAKKEKTRMAISKKINNFESRKEKH